MNAISATKLERAAALTKQIESLRGDLDKAQEVANGLSGQLAPLQKELDDIMGYKAVKAPGTRFTPEQRAKISAGLTASWARKRQAKLEAETAADAAAGLAPDAGTPANA